MVDLYSFAQMLWVDFFANFGRNVRLGTILGGKVIRSIGFGLTGLLLSGLNENI